MSGWQHVGESDGTSTFQLESWSRFFDFLEAEIFSYSGPQRRSFIWRGQRRANWSLSTTLDRLLEVVGISDGPQDALEDVSKQHLERFKYASRGRRGLSPAALSENEWWSLGQHFGLATPLLDWTRAPFAALYFAFEDASVGNVPRAIYALNENAVFAKELEIQNGPSIEKGRVPIVEIVDPMSDENQRLVSQGGCFTRAPIGTPIEQWVQRAFEGSSDPILIRIEIPDTDRLGCLQALNRMNINHLSLFPDLSGASRSTNLRLEFEHCTVRKNA
ncbi:FRG domain-containing protein [Edaphobacter modestus]|uniref:FRG domain-containing protein n=1 Tax=Edaphobacter modestus TaxID=388466 RepID=UPI002414D161|nr:FRG domain-containing protein [Edaphobacter modestus]